LCKLTFRQIAQNVIGHFTGPANYWTGADSAMRQAGANSQVRDNCHLGWTQIIISQMTPWPLAVLLDFDGVIVNSEPLHFYAFHQILKAEGIELSEEEYYRELIGFDDRGAFRHLFEKRKTPLEPKTLLHLMTRKSEVVIELIEDRKYHALPGVEEFVRGLWRHYPLGICSGALREEIEAMLEGVALRDCFNVIVAAEDVAVGKPDPQGYLLCAKLISQNLKSPLKPSDCLVVEDAPNVIKAAKAAGFPTLGVATSHAIDQLVVADWRVGTLQPHEVAKQIPGLRMGI
jgi:beta-phosphoglucomutase